MSNSGWIGVDLDGTLAHYDKWRGLIHIGDPVPAGGAGRLFLAKFCSKGQIPECSWRPPFAFWVTACDREWSWRGGERQR